MSSARKGDDTDEDEEKKRFCRYCFEDDAQERLIAPCTYFYSQCTSHISSIRVLAH